MTHHQIVTRARVYAGAAGSDRLSSMTDFVHICRRMGVAQRPHGAWRIASQMLDGNPAEPVLTLQNPDHNPTRTPPTSATWSNLARNP